MSKTWYGVKIFVTDDMKKHKLLVDFIKPFKEEFKNSYDSYHFFRYAEKDGTIYIRFRLFGDEDNMNQLRNELEKRLEGLKGTLIIRYEPEPYAGEEFAPLFQYGAEAFFTLYETCMRLPEDERKQRYYSGVQQLLHLFFNPLGFDYFGENQASLDKIYGNIRLMDEHPRVGSREAAQTMLNMFKERAKQILDEFKAKRYSVD